MVKFSSIMKGTQEQEEKKELSKKTEPAREISAPPFEKAQWPPIPKQTPEEQKKVSLPQDAAFETDIVGTSAWKLYQQVVDFMRSVVTRIGANEKIRREEFVDHVRSLAEEISHNKEHFVSIITAETPDNYIIGHQVDVCILAIQMGIELGYGDEKLLELGCGALIFDIGMLKVLDIVKQQKKLGENELDEVRRHPEYGAAILKQLTDMPQSVIDIALQHHERPDGKGYPRGLKGREISEFSKIISIADVYIALTHSRPERRRLSPHDAIKELLQNARYFSPTVLRSLLSVISIYPIGTWVELNSHDIGRVVRLNAGQALRPAVELVCDHHGQPLEKRSVVDLMENPQLYITSVVDNANIEKWGLEKLVASKA